MNRMTVHALALAATLAAGPALAAPEPPQQVRVQVLNGALQISWQKSISDPVYVSGYEVVRGVFPTGPYQPVCVTMKGALCCTDRNAQPDKQYFYRVRAMGIGDDAPSELTFQVPGQLPPLAPVAER